MRRLLGILLALGLACPPGGAQPAPAADPAPVAGSPAPAVAESPLGLPSAPTGLSEPPPGLVARQEGSAVVLRPLAPLSVPLIVQTRSVGLLTFQDLDTLAPGAECRLESLSFEQDRWFRLRTPGPVLQAQNGPACAFSADWPAPILEIEVVESSEGMALRLVCPPQPPGLVPLARLSFRPSGKLMTPLEAGGETRVALPPGCVDVEVESANRSGGRLGRWTSQGSRPVPTPLPPYVQDLAGILESIQPTREEHLHAGLTAAPEPGRLAIRLRWKAADLPPGTRLERRQAETRQFQLVQEVRDQQEHLDEQVVAEQIYEYRLAFAEPGRRGLSEVARGGVGLPRLDTLMVAVLDDHRAQLRWRPPPGIQGVEIEEQRVGYDREREMYSPEPAKVSVVARLSAQDSVFVADNLSARERTRWRITCQLDGKPGLPVFSEEIQTDFPQPRLAYYEPRPGGGVELYVSLQPHRPDWLDLLTLERQDADGWQVVGELRDMRDLLFRDVVPQGRESVLYRLTASNAHNRAVSADSPVNLQTRFDAPRIAGIRLVDLHSLRVSWEPVTDSLLTACQVERRVAGGEFETMATLAVPDTVWVDTTLAAGMLVEYRTRGLSGDRPSQASRPQTARVPDPSLDMVAIPGGNAWRGADGRDLLPDEGPARQVALSAFLLGTREVSNQQFRLFCESTGRAAPQDPAFMGGDGYVNKWPHAPVVNVSWFDAIDYCNWLSSISGLPPAYDDQGQGIALSTGYRLPTEAEFEYAVRGRENRANRVADLAPVNLVNLYQPADGTPGVDLQGRSDWAASPHGALNLLGNVWEWVQDWYAPNYYQASERCRDPRGPRHGEKKIRKGGGFDLVPEACRVSYRLATRPGLHLANTGFRVARTPHVEESLVQQTAPGGTATPGTGAEIQPPTGSDTRQPLGALRLLDPDSLQP